MVGSLPHLLSQPAWWAWRRSTRGPRASTLARYHIAPARRYDVVARWAGETRSVTDEDDGTIWVEGDTITVTDPMNESHSITFSLGGQ